MKRVVLSLALCFPLMVWAQGFQINLQGQKQNAMAGAGSALALDHSSIFYNPGAVPFVSGNSVIVGANPLWFKAAFMAKGSDVNETVKNKMVSPFHFYAALGPRTDIWKIGLGVYTPFGGAVDWGREWSGRYILTSLDLRAIYFQPTLSLRLSESVGIGAGFVYNYAEIDLQRALPFSLADNSYGGVKLKGKGKGYGWNAGIFVKTLSGIDFALSYRSKVITKVKTGDALFTVPDVLLPYLPAENTFNTEIPLPATLNFGIAVPISKSTQLAFDASWVQWHVYQELAVDFDQNTILLNDLHFPRNYKDGYSFKLGLQQQLSPKLSLAAGLGYVETPVQDGFVSPEAPDNNRYVFAAGLSYQMGTHFELNASFLFEDIRKRYDENLETKLAGRYKTYVYTPGLSLSYKW